MIPILFDENEKNFTSQGLGALKDAISCTVDEERNGIYELEMEYPITGIHYEDIAKRRIIYAIPSPYRAPQPFRIYEISRPMRGVTTVYAAHLSYDLNGIPVSPFSATGIGPALDGLKSHMEIANDFNFATDITSDAGFSMDVPTACRSCLGGIEGSILDTYGGEYLWDKFTVNLKANRGVNSGVSIRYRKNLTDLKHNENVENTVTGIYPYWNDSNGNLVMCDPPIIWAEGNFGYQKAIPVSFTEEFETQPTTEQLQQAAESYIKRNDIGVPTVSMTVSFIQLEQMTGYEDITLLEKCDLCDTVTVQYEQLGVNATAKIVKISTNVLTERYNNMEIGSVRANIAQTIADQQKEIEKKPPMSMIEGAISGATETITGNQGGNVILRLNEAGKPYELLIMDTDDIKTAQNVWRFNQSGWGLSKNGYNGPYEIAATINDGFVADFIKAGTMLADRIRGGSLILGGMNNQNGIFIVQNAKGEEVVRCDMNGIKAIAAEITGTITGSTITGGNITGANISGANVSGTQINGGEIEGTNIDGVNISGSNISGSRFDSYITGNTLGVRIAAGNMAMYWPLATGNEQIARIGPSHIIHNGVDYYGPKITGNGEIWFEVDGLDSAYFLNDNTIFFNKVTARDGLAVLGTKQRLVKTNNFGDRAQYCYETATPYFGDIGTGKLNDEGECVISIDEIFAETVSETCEYVVFLQKEGGGDIWIETKECDYFTVKGTPGMKFAWEIKRPQKDYEYTRLEDPEMEKNIKIKPKNEVETEFEKMLEKYGREMEVVL